MRDRRRSRAHAASGRAPINSQRFPILFALVCLATLNLSGCLGFSRLATPLGTASSSNTTTAQSASASDQAAATTVQTSVATLQTSPSPVAFGTVLAGVNNSQPLYLTNSGTATLSVSQIAASGSGFGVSGFSLPLTLTAGQSASMAITFESAQAGAASGVATITSNATNSPTTASLSASVGSPVVQLSANPASISFGTDAIGVAATQNVTLTNNGNAMISISSVAAAGAGFSVSGASNVTLAPNQSATAAVTFDPASAGSASGSLTVTSNAPQVQVALSGTGSSAPQYSVAVNWTPSTSVVVGYFVYRGTGPNAQLSKLSGVVASTNYTDAAVAAGQSYTYAVTAVNAANVESALSTTVTVTIP